MYDRDLIASIKQVGQLRSKPGYYQTLVDLFAAEVARSFESLSLTMSSPADSADHQPFEDGWRIVHKLKGSAASIGAVAVANSCSQLIRRWRNSEHSAPMASAAGDISALQRQCHQAILDMRGF